jgi:EAL domain-containing protein (putative c-di-GMP-specific phosphodiesterase class I)
MHNSNLGYLRSFTFDCLKIDRTFVGGLGETDTADSTDQAIIRAVTALADTLRLDVVAEGIESEEQRGLLLDLGCRLGQGYLFSRPRPAPEITQLLTAPDRRAIPAPRPASVPAGPAPSRSAAPCRDTVRP